MDALNTYLARRRAVRIARHLGPTMRKRLRQEHLVDLQAIAHAKSLVDGTTPWPDRNSTIRVSVQGGPLLWEEEA